MAVVTMRQLLQAGLHFGHQTKKWDPKMERYLAGERNGIYLIDLKQTLSGVEKAYAFVRDLVGNGGTIMFVGTKKQVQVAMAEQASACGMPFINERWLGGMLTNFSTISARVRKLTEFDNAKTAGEFEGMPKKEALQLTRAMEKLHRNLGGIRGMAKLPDALFVMDTNKEHLAITEARKLSIPVVAVVDSNCNPDIIDYPIPGNDDAIRAARLMASVIAEAVKEGRFIASKTLLRSASVVPEPALATSVVIEESTDSLLATPEQSGILEDTSKEVGE